MADQAATASDPWLLQTVAAVDHEIEQVRATLPLVQPRSLPMLWEKIDALLDQRLILELAEREIV